MSGAASKEQITSNLAARQVAWDREPAESLDRVAEEPGAYWRTRAELVWN